MTNSDAGGLFGDEAERYDATIRMVDPFYAELHKMLVRFVVAAAPNMTGQGMIALDIGSGTGAEAVGLLRELPEIRLVGVDTSEQMNAIFCNRAKKSRIGNNRISLVHGDILSKQLSPQVTKSAQQLAGRTTFDVAMSCFTLHHFDPAGKLAVFHMVYQLLEPGGIFLMGDLFNFDNESDWLNKTVYDWETRWIAENFDRARQKQAAQGNKHQASILDKLKDKWMRHYEVENCLDSITAQLQMLRTAGFTQVGNPLRYWQIGLLFAKKGS